MTQPTSQLLSKKHWRVLELSHQPQKSLEGTANKRNSLGPVQWNGNSSYEKKLNCFPVVPHHPSAISTGRTLSFRVLLTSLTDGLLPSLGRVTTQKTLNLSYTLSNQHDISELQLNFP